MGYILAYKIDADGGLGKGMHTLAWSSNLLWQKRLMSEVLPTPEFPSSTILYVRLDRVELAMELIRTHKL